MAMIELAGNIAAKAEISGDLTVVYNLAYQHLCSATELARQSGNIERANLGRDFGAAFEQLRTYVSSSIILSVCALEANINEHLISSDGVLKQYNQDDRVRIFASIQSLGILDKYEFGLAINEKPNLKFSREPFESVQYLVKFRNRLVHYIPESDKDSGRSKKLEDHLRSKVEESPFVTKSDYFLTRRAMSYSCAKWAVNTALRFSKEYSKILGVRDKFLGLKCLR